MILQDVSRNAFALSISTRPNAQIHHDEDALYIHSLRITLYISLHLACEIISATELLKLSILVTDFSRPLYSDFVMLP